jgi:hypothetical protein
MLHRAPRRFGRSILLITAALLAARCQDELPAAPDVLVEGVTIYEHAGFSGDSALLTADVEDLRDFKGPCEHASYGGYYSTTTYTYDWNDCLSSIKVAPGWRATVFLDPGFHDDSLDVTADVEDFSKVRGPCSRSTWNDCISAIRVRRQ